MNKFLKLPLFLGVVGGLCTAVLATTYAITNEEFLKREAERKNAAFKDILIGFGLTDADGSIKAGVETIEYIVDAEDSNFELSSKLSKVGITRKVSISFNEEVVGAFFEGSVIGFNKDVPIAFQLSFKEDKCYEFSCTHTESGPGVGFMDKIPDLVKDKELSYFTSAAFDTDLGAGATYSKSGIMPAIVAAASDYAASL